MNKLDQLLSEIEGRVPRKWFLELNKKNGSLLGFASDDGISSEYLFASEPPIGIEREIIHVIENEPTDIARLVKALKLAIEQIEDAVEHTSSNLEDMQYYFENKCVPTVDEVTQCAIADSKLRYAIGKIEAALEGKAEG